MALSIRSHIHYHHSADLDRALMDIAVPLRKRDLVFVVNPMSANGATGRKWKKMLPQLSARLGEKWNICEAITSGPLHAVDMTREAIKDGAGAVIAVGGDGTLHEVVNGFFEAGSLVSHGQGVKHSTTLGLIPLGTGSDFARTFGWKNDPFEAIDRIVKGDRCKVDIGVVDGENGEPHYFINVADAHLSAKSGFFSSHYKRFGNLCYVIGALTAFMEHADRDLRIKIDRGEWVVIQNVTAVCIGNAKYFGGGMKITPAAHPCSGGLEIVIVQNFKWYDFLLNLHKLYQGRHISLKKIFTRSANSIEIEEVVKTGKIFVQCDGEFLGFLPRRFHVIPGAIDMFV